MTVCLGSEQVEMQGEWTNMICDIVIAAGGGKSMLVCDGEMVV